MVTLPENWEQNQIKTWREHSGLPQDYDWEQALLQGSFCVPEQEYNDFWAQTDSDLPELQELRGFHENVCSDFSVWKKDNYVFMLCKKGGGEK